MYLFLVFVCNGLLLMIGGLQVLLSSSVLSPVVLAYGILLGVLYIEEPPFIQLGRGSSSNAP